MAENLSNIFESETLETKEGELLLRHEGPLAIGYQGVARLEGNEVPYEVIGSNAVLVKEGVTLNSGDDIFLSEGVAEEGLIVEDIPEVVGKTFTAEPRISAIMILTNTRTLYVHTRTEERKVGDIIGPNRGF